MVSELQKKKYRIKEKEEYPNRQAHQADLSVVELVPIRTIHHHCTFQELTLKNHLLFVHRLNLLNNNLNFVLKEIPVTKKKEKKIGAFIQKIQFLFCQLANCVLLCEFLCIVLRITLRMVNFAHLAIKMFHNFFSPTPLSLNEIIYIVGIF